MKLINIETYDTKIYTFRNIDDELYHVVKQDSFLNKLYPEYRFIDSNLNEIVDDKTINEINNTMKNWQK